MPPARKTTSDTFGKRLARARLTLGAERGRLYTQSELARALGVTPPTVSQWEADASEPTLEMIARIAGELGVDPAYLAFGSLARVAPSVKTYSPDEIAEFRRIVAESEAQAPAEPPKRRSNGR